MRHFSKVILLVALFMTAISQPATAQTQTNCPGAPASRLVIGKMAHVTPGASSNLRDQPSKSGAILGAIPGDSVAFVLAGPTCADGYAWWQVSVNGQNGWMAEGSGSTYFIDPTTSAAAEFTIPDGAKTVAVLDGNSSFTYNGVFGKKVQAVTVFAVKPNPNDPMTPAAPDFTSFTFEEQPPTLDQSYNEPTLSVYPVAEYQKVNDEAKQRIADLLTLLKNKPTQFADDQPIPVLPPVNAAQVFRANVKYLPFKNGSGVRFLSMYAQGISPVTNDMLIYIYQGLTNDGKYLVTAAFPIKSSVLPDKFEDAKDFPDMNATNVADLFKAYMTKTTAVLDAATPDQFTPNLNDLDALLQSVNILQ